MSKRKIESEFDRIQLEILFSQADVTIPAVITGSLLYVLMLWSNGISASVLFPWAIGFAFINALRYVHAKAFFSAPRDNEDLWPWLRVFVFGSTVTGLLLSTISIYVLPLLDPFLLTFTLLLHAGLAAAAMSAYSVSRYTYLSYSTITLVPLSIALLLNENYSSFGILLIMFYLFMVASMYSINSKAMQNIELQIENQRLVDRLEKEKQNVDLFNQRLKDDLAHQHATKRELLSEKQVAENRANQLSVISREDALTGVANRRSFDEFVVEQWSIASKTGRSVGLIICDIDYFKRYNDRYGHALGDNALKQVAAAISQNVRKYSDLVARYGGEEFAIVLPDADIDTSETIARKVQLAVKALQIPHADSSTDENVTCSYGVSAVVPTKLLSPDNLFKAADTALYEAKGAGRNQIRTKAVELSTTE